MKHILHMKPDGYIGSKKNPDGYGELKGHRIASDKLWRTKRA
jgi:hypothetical protein